MPLSLSWSHHSGSDSLLIRGLTPHLLRLPPANLSQRLSLFPSDTLPGHLPHSDGAGGDGLTPLQPLAGRFELAGEDLHFLPRFPFVPGLSYSLVLRTASEHQVAQLRRPATPLSPTATVTAIYPSAPEIPVNLLKLYLHFSHPMSEGHALRSVTVCSLEYREQLSAVFLNVDPELWDPQHMRLTMLLDLGWIKRGLVPNREAGYPLVENDTILMTVETTFRDAAGQPLLPAPLPSQGSLSLKQREKGGREVGFSRRYHVGPPLRSRLDPTLWTLNPPRPGTTDPLTVTFDRPLDHALLAHCLSVVTSTASPLAGSVTISPGERSWLFTPTSPWPVASFTLRIDSQLKDLAGNSLNRLFDRDLSLPDGNPLALPYTTLPFTCDP